MRNWLIRFGMLGIEGEIDDSVAALAWWLIVNAGRLHEGGNPGYRQGLFYRVTAPVLDPTGGSRTTWPPLMT